MKIKLLLKEFKSMQLFLKTFISKVYKLFKIKKIVLKKFQGWQGGA